MRLWYLRHDLDVSVALLDTPVRLDYRGGLRYPHLEPIPGARPRLDEILAPRRA